MSEVSIWMPFYIGDYVADTLGLTKSEHGSYLLAIIAYWRKGSPLKDKEIKQILGEDSERILEFFTENNGFWAHKRIEKEIENALLMKENFSKRGKLGADARWGNNASSMQQASLKQCSSNAQAMLADASSPSPSPSPKSSTAKSPSAKVVRKKSNNMPIEEFIESLKLNPAYQQIDFVRELGKMDAWLLTRPGRHKTKAFIINWLNKIDAGYQVSPPENAERDRAEKEYLEGKAKYLREKAERAEKERLENE